MLSIATAEIAGIAKAFVGARRTGRSLASYPGTMPTTLADGYAVQDHAIGLAAGVIAGWKVGRIMPRCAQSDADRLAGPIFADAVAENDDPKMSIFAEGFAAVEAEFVLRIGVTPDPAKPDYTLVEAAALIDAVHVGLEIASSPFPGINANGPAVTVSDFGNNHGLVIGPRVDHWTDETWHWPVTLLIDGTPVGQGCADALPDGPPGAVRFLLMHLVARGVSLKAGQWISSGAITGVHPVMPGQRVEARFGVNHVVRCGIAAIQSID